MILIRTEKLCYAVTGMLGCEMVQGPNMLSVTDLLIILMMKIICPIYHYKDSQWIMFAIRMD